MFFLALVKVIRTAPMSATVATWVPPQGIQPPATNGRSTREPAPLKMDRLASGHSARASSLPHQRSASRSCPAGLVAAAVSSAIFAVSSACVKVPCARESVPR